ncbi:MAG: acyl-CoA dehydrogenase family protein [Chloroflexota bacterium]|nr:acyl-CoA dehydrogenase family protein [Chloroflexota bacterium]
MDFAFTPEEERFRDELHQLLLTNLPGDWAKRGLAEPIDSEERHALADLLSKQLAERKWLTMAWPEKFGGLDASYLMQYLFNEEMAYLDAPGGGGVGVTSVGPAIMMYGSDEQQRIYLPRIANADDRWAALYSEPGAGSDLASIQTRAVRDGDEYVINGLKTWVAGADRATMGWLAARTDPNGPKHRGLSTFAVPMDDPGVEIRPIENLAGERQLSEVLLHDVRVPIENRVGPENRGWYHVASTLDFERSGVASYARGKRHIEQLVDLVKENSTLSEQRAAVRYELADRWIELQVGFNVAQRIPWLQTQGISPNHEASVSKVYGSEMTQRIAGTGVRLLGMAGLLQRGTDGAPAGGAFARHYLTSAGSTIAAGTSEIQRNIIAQRGLGLPR